MQFNILDIIWIVLEFQYFFEKNKIWEVLNYFLETVLDTFKKRGKFHVTSTTVFQR